MARTPEIGQGLGRILSCGARKQEQETLTPQQTVSRLPFAKKIVQLYLLMDSKSTIKNCEVSRITSGSKAHMKTPYLYQEESSRAPLSTIPLASK